MDKRVLAGIAIVLVIVVGIFGYNMFIKPPPGDGGDEEPPVTGPATIFGKITDEETGDALGSVTVEVDGKTVTTASDGTFEVEVDTGSYVITVSKEGYEPGSSTVSASEEQAYTVNLGLTPVEEEEEEEPPTGEIMLKALTRHGSDITFTAEKLFLESDLAKEHNIVDIKWMAVGPTLWVDTIKRTGDIDFGWGGGPVLFDIVYNEGLLAPLDSEGVLAVLGEIPDEVGGVPAKRYKDGEVYWTGSAIASFGFTINKQYLEDEGLPEPTKWTDLANETYAVTLPSPSIGTADATKSTSNTRMFEIILQAHGWREGWSLLTRKGANSRIYDRSESVRDAAITGVIGVGTTIDFYGYTAQLENPGIAKYILPEDGTIVNADPVALMATSPHPEAAQAFIAWLLSAEGQKPWLSPKINRLPMNPEVFNTPEGLKRADLKEIYDKTKEALIIEFSDELALSYEFAMMYYYHATIVRPQLKLVEVWMDLTRAEETGDITHQEFLELAHRLGDPHLVEFTNPETEETVAFTQEFAQEYNSRLTADATFRTQLTDAWTSAAEAHYEAIRAEVNALTG